MLHNDKSLDAMLSFLDWVAQKGKMKPATASALKAASNKVLASAQGSEKRDLSKLNFEQAFAEFERAEGRNLNADSRKTYRNRTRKAVDEFLAWRSDPENYAPSFPQRARHTKGMNGNTGTHKTGQARLALTFPEDVALSHQFPLRREVLIKILGLPRDLKMSEAKRLGAFLMTLCEDYEPEA